jgi:hypothetical protein
MASGLSALLTGGPPKVLELDGWRELRCQDRSKAHWLIFEVISGVVRVRHGRLVQEIGAGIRGSVDRASSRQRRRRRQRHIDWSSGLPMVSAPRRRSRLLSSAAVEWLKAQLRSARRVLIV